MPESQVIAGQKRPITKEILKKDLRTLGVQSGDLLIVHSSLKALGWVCGGAQTVIEALEEVLGLQGTLVMPAHSTQLTEPEYWLDPPVDPSWHPAVRGSLPAFRPDLTPTRDMGVIAETFRGWQGTLRSGHPHYSFCARGPLAAEILASHSFDFGLGPQSPLGKLYDLGAQVLLLGVSWDVCTGFHLAQYAQAQRPQGTFGAPVLVEGRRQWVDFLDIDLDTEDFLDWGAELETQGLVRRGPAGGGTARRFFLKDCVELAKKHLTKV